MRKRIVSFVVSLALVLALTPQAYALPEYVESETLEDCNPWD